MTLLNVKGISINASPTDFHALAEGDKHFSVDSIGDNADGVQRVIEFRNSGILFPASVCFNYFKQNPQAKDFCGISDFYFNRADLIFNKMGLHGVGDYKSHIKRVLTTLRLTTTLENFDSLDKELWEAWIGVMKLPTSQWHPEVSPTELVKSAFSKIGQYLDLDRPHPNYSFCRPVRVKRAPSYEKKGRDFILHTPPEFAHAKELFDEFAAASGIKSIKPYNDAFCKFAEWMEEYPLSERTDFLVFLKKPRHDPSWLEYTKRGYTASIPITAGHRVQLMVSFVDWVIENYLTTNDGEEFVSSGYPIVTAKEQKLLDVERKRQAHLRASEARSTPMPLRYIKKLKQILREDNWKWPRSLDVHQFQIAKNGRIISKWNPIFAYLVYGMLELPWRRIQFLSLDSGEGDTLEFDIKSGKWRENSSDHAGYWQRDARVKRKHRGVVAYDGNPNKGVGFYVNTNKTADIEVGHGEQSGYFTPWQNAEMIELFYELRNWQMENNPVSEPTPYARAWTAFNSKTHRPTESIMRQVPDRFYLFRDIQGVEGKDIPPTENRVLNFWRLLMDELETRLRNEGEDVRIIETRNASGGPLTSYYNMHGLRVAGLTAFAEAGVPIQILSKLVAGHASILMTLYYVKYSTAHVTDVLTKARLEIEASAAAKFKTEIAATSIENAARIAVAAETYTLERIADKTFSSDLFADVSIGICPFAGTRCGDGLQISKDRTGPVPGGPRNCLQCRHFVTGLPWLIPLVLNQQKLSAEVQEMASRSNRMLSELEALKAERASFVKQGKRDSIPAQLQQKIAFLDTEHETLTLQIEDKLSNMHRQHVFIERIKALDGNESSQNASPENLPAKVFDASQPDYFEGSRLELIDSVIQGSRVYPFLENGALERERQEFIDQIMFRNGMVPLSMLALDDHQKKRAADAAAELLLRKYSAVEVNLLISGEQTFDSLSVDGNFGTMFKEVLRNSSQTPLLSGSSHGQ